LESFGALDKLDGFVSGFGRGFYKREVGAGNHSKVVLQRTAGKTLIDDRYVLNNDVVVPFWAGKEIGWEIVSK
jgi:dihydroorotase